MHTSRSPLIYLVIDSIRKKRRSFKIRVSALLVEVFWLCWPVKFNQAKCKVLSIRRASLPKIKTFASNAALSTIKGLMRRTQQLSNLISGLFIVTRAIWWKVTSRNEWWRPSKSSPKYSNARERLVPSVTKFIHFTKVSVWMHVANTSSPKLEMECPMQCWTNYTWCSFLLVYNPN